jgi:alpha-ketoglutarate-dependent taurine dioxygenase
VTEQGLPHVITAATAGTTATAFLAVARETVCERVREFGAVLLRGFDVPSADAFARVMRALSGTPLPYTEPAVSARAEVFPRHVDADRDSWPRILVFHCVRPPDTRGATLLADTRRILRTLDPAVRDEFATRGWRVNGCRRRAIHPHPVTGEAVWFNDVPAAPRYGDGEPVPEDVRTHVRDCYRAAQRRVAWYEGDLLLVDNMLAAHGREPYTGRRDIVVAAAEPVR